MESNTTARRTEDIALDLLKVCGITSQYRQ